MAMPQKSTNTRNATKPLTMSGVQKVVRVVLILVVLFDDVNEGGHRRT